MVVVVNGFHDDAVAAIADELFDGGDLEALLDEAGLEVAARGGGEAEEEEELEWLSNKDAFPTVETMMPAPPVVLEQRAKVARRVRPSQGPNAAAAVEGLHCRHCGTTKTPQWREGPEGRRTLCNACGVWYRSGRLVPEYRPLNSPTFSPQLHSNIHRCVLELRHHRPKSPSAVPAPAAAAEPEPEQQRRRWETKQETPPEHEHRPPDIPTPSPEPHSNKQRRVVELLRQQGPSASANLALAVAAAAAAATVAGRQRRHRATKETPPEHEHPPPNIPTTSPEPHSNKHRRVVELPRQGPSSSANLALAVVATAATVGRECAHCRTTKTPAWRRGPDSRRKLCNACGNKYRSGNLVPEYRPLNSPTFSPEALLDNAALQVAARGVGGAAAADEELERLPNKDAFPTVETMAPAPPVAVAENQTTKVAVRGRPAAGWQCRHCCTTKTPQRRDGPEGRHTLCNACGVRYRSGLLLPEYRPLNSPTFSPELHSNIHRRVLELRHRPAVPGPTMATAAEHVRKEIPPELRPPDTPTTSPETHSNKHRSVVELLQQTGAIVREVISALRFKLLALARCLGTKYTSL